MRLTAVSFIALTLALPALAWNPLEFTGGGGSGAYVEPAGYYQVLIPSGFDCTQKKTFIGGARRTRSPDRVLNCSGKRIFLSSFRFGANTVFVSL